MKRIVFVRLLAVAFVSVFCTGLGAAETRGRVERVLDGDTVHVATATGRLTVRLGGIDAPEKSMPFGPEARDSLAALVQGREATVVHTAIDRYGRTIGVLIVEGKDINAEMLRLGMAWVYRQYYRSGPYFDIEAEAKRERRGLWSQDNPMPPWLYRRSRRRPLGYSTETLHDDTHPNLVHELGR